MYGKGILTKYLNKHVSLIIDLGDKDLGGQDPIKVEGTLMTLHDAPLNEYRLRITDWVAEITFTVVRALVKLELGKDGEVEGITITVLPQEEF